MDRSATLTRQVSGARGMQSRPASFQDEQEEEGDDDDDENEDADAEEDAEDDDYDDDYGAPLVRQVSGDAGMRTVSSPPVGRSSSSVLDYADEEDENSFGAPLVRQVSGDMGMRTLSSPSITRASTSYDSADQQDEIFGSDGGDEELDLGSALVRQVFP